MSPEYFLHKMEWWEVNCYLAGIQRRQHAQWETTRWQIVNILNMFRKKDSPPLKLFDLIKFPWEKTNKNKHTNDITEEEIQQLQAEMDAWSLSPEK